MSCDHAPSPNPRDTGCVKCGRAIPGRVPRNLPLEREIVARAARELGRLGIDETDAETLSNFADKRAWPGGVRPDMDHDQEAREELADCRHYLVWKIIALWPYYERGELWACELVAKRLTALGGVLIAWHALR